jgi:hypothetical protein
MATGKTILHGSRCALYVGDRLIGWGSDVSVDIRFQNLPVEVLGEPHPVEIVPVGVMVDVTIGFVRILESDVIQDALMASVSGDNPGGLVAFPEITIKVMSKYAAVDRPVLIVEGAKPAQYRFTVQARTLVAQNMTFQGRVARFTSEAA